MSLERTISAIRIKGYGLVDADIANIVLIAADNIGCPESEEGRQVCMENILVAMRAEGFPKPIPPRQGAIATVSMPEEEWIKWEQWAQRKAGGGAGRHATRIKKSRKKKRTKRRRKSRKRKSRRSKSRRR